MISGLYIALLVVALWIVILGALAGPIRKSKNFSFYGPMLMIKTSKDRKILDRASAKFPGIIFSKISVAIFLIWGILSLVFLIYEAYLITQIHITTSPPLNEYLVIPGLNPAIPIFYGTFALFIGVVVHELMHGVVSRKHNIKVNAVGALFFVVPIGAFVEPDQEEIEKADPIVRRRIFASGAGVNIVIAFVSFIILLGVMMPVAQPAHSGFYVSSVDSSFPASSLVQDQSEVIAVNGMTGDAFYNMYMNSTLQPGTMAQLTVYDGHSLSNVSIPSGIVIDGVLSGYPAAAANITPGSLIYSIGSTQITNYTMFSNILDNILPGTAINVTVINYQSKDFQHPLFSEHTMVTASKYDYYAKYYPGDNSPAYKNQSFMGIQASYMGIIGYPMGLVKGIVFGSSVFQDFPNGLFQTLALPFQGLSPVPGHMAALYNVPGPSWLYWGVMNTLFWLFYINFLLALLNTLPAAILDGGQFFKDTLKIASKSRFFRAFEKDKNIAAVANFLTLLVVFLMLYLIIAPRII